MTLGVVYRIKFDSGRSYIGLTSHLRNRINQHEHDKRGKSKLPIHCAMRKYKYSFVVIARVPVFMLSLAERLCIWFYGAYRNGYNLTRGGEGLRGVVVSEETREKKAAHFTKPFHGFALPDLTHVGSWKTYAQCGRELGLRYDYPSRVIKGQQKQMCGYWFTDKDLDYVTANRNEILKSLEPSKTKNMPEYHRKWSSERMKGNKFSLGRRLTKQEREELVIKRGVKPIAMYDLDNNFVRSFVSQSLAAEYLGCSDSTIHCALKGRNKTAAGHIWKYL